MFKYLASALKFSCGILGLYCLGLAVAPIGYAGEANPAPGAFSSAKDESSIEGGKGSDNKGGEYRPNPNRFANLRAAQLQAQLEADRNAYLNASNRVKQVQVKKSQPSPNSAREWENNYPNSITNNSSSELASAKAVQTQAAINLSKTQHRVSLFLKSVKSKRNMLSTRMISH